MTSDMRQTVDDVTSTPKAHRLLVIVTALVVMVTISAPLPVAMDPAAPSSATASAFTSSSLGNTSESAGSSKEITVELRVLYICDSTSAEFCLHTNASQEEMAEGDCKSNVFKGNRSKARLPPVSVLPRSCVDMTSSTEHIKLDNNSDATSSKFNASNAKDNRKHTNRSNSKSTKDSFYLCWRMQDGGLVVERNLPGDAKTSMRARVFYHTISGSETMVDKMRTLDILDDFNSSDIIVVIGDTVTVQVVAFAAEWRKLPVFGYITSFPDERKVRLLFVYIHVLLEGLQG
ncbi:hypothetical protein ElyMa_004023300 [Elysia marginata]|uniref:Receptor ligand binding region domain-containing protein n=1 Tax=Elysia marginata TaxID=1093978 RepID=A0AAV4G2R7_9GAST|nr:hypothetical protein ElyMa_004023300 [Elysia marginata]